jgi:hypothetical protein
MRPSKTTARAGTKKVSGARAQPMPHQKIAMRKIKPAPRIEFDLEGSASFAKHMDRRTTAFLCRIEWSWSPVHHRMDSYYLLRCRTYWVLWVKRHGDYGEEWEQPIPIARCQRDGFGEDCKAAAMILLAAVLTEEIRQLGSYGSELDRFHAITDAGLLSAKELDVVADTVWGTISAT